MITGIGKNETLTRQKEFLLDFSGAVRSQCHSLPKLAVYKFRECWIPVSLPPPPRGSALQLAAFRSGGHPLQQSPETDRNFCNINVLDGVKLARLPHLISFSYRAPFD